MTILTLDTNCVNSKQETDALNELERLHDADLVALHETDTMDTEMTYGEQGTPLGRPYDRGLAKSARFKEDLGPLIVGYSRVGHAVVATNPVPPEEDAARPIHEMSDDGRLNAIAAVLFPGQSRQELGGHLRDVMHLATHAKYRRDIFVTQDGDFLRHRDELSRRFDLVVMTPDEALAHVRGHRRRPSKRAPATIGRRVRRFLFALAGLVGVLLLEWLWSSVRGGAFDFYMVPAAAVAFVLWRHYPRIVGPGR